ncbi:MAG: GNAT family N-acetyltransferase, partial [Actinomycetota bacterium]|nr:GNAT family N-acetyltransferase [Actinomycetota bacterium]
AAADRAAQALADALAGCGRPWVLSLGPLPHTDPFLDALHRRLPDVVVVDADPVPLVRPPALPHACTDPSDCTTFSVNLRKNLRKAANRLRADGRCAELRFVRDGEEVEGWLDRLWELRCRRDRLVGRLHADPGRAAERFWHAGLRTLAALGEVELGLLHIDAQLAAYVLAVQDAAACRVLEGRFDSALSRYSPGKLLEAELVRRVACGARRPVDWMNGVAPHKLVAATDVQPMRELHAAGGKPGLTDALPYPEALPGRTR